MGRNRTRMVVATTGPSCHLDYLGFPASRIIPLGPVRQRCTSPGRILPELDRTQYRFGVQKRQGSFRMGGNRTRMVVATTGPSCHLDYFVRTIETLFSILVY
ncbi:hypothetical protein DY000_02011777 [Brassica cretica]|uniref:Flavoprotein domain-containing protein n=1 Tax=Brassica cretica TaxID=69181 RepID=A0ABQ7D1J8_BRACR|nr:hypothetical protein DY000_02011777 [Brassica cretica]